MSSAQLIPKICHPPFYKDDLSLMIQREFSCPYIGLTSKHSIRIDGSNLLLYGQFVSRRLRLDFLLSAIFNRDFRSFPCGDQFERVVLTEGVFSKTLSMETSIKGPYEQIMLFGDSITEWSNSQESGFAFQPALQNCESTASHLIGSIETVYC